MLWMCGGGCCREEGYRGFNILLTEIGGKKAQYTCVPCLQSPTLQSINHIDGPKDPQNKNLK